MVVNDKIKVLKELKSANLGYKHKSFIIINLKKYLICNADVDNDEIVGKRTDCQFSVIVVFKRQRKFHVEI